MMFEWLLSKGLDTVPLPLLLGLGIILATGWLLSQLKSLPNHAHSIKERPFWLILGLVLIGEVAWFSYKIHDERSFGLKFPDKEFGILVIQFDNDKDGSATRIFANLLQGILQDELQNISNISVRSSSKQAPEESAFSIFAATKAALIIEGVLDQQDKVLLKFIKQGDPDWQRVRNFVSLRDPGQFVSRLKTTLPTYRNDKDIWLQNEFAGLKKQLDAQSQAITELRTQLGVLKNKNVTASLASQSTTRSGGLKGKGLVVGINAYKTVGHLSFARSDAEAMEMVLKSSGLDTTSLLDEAATKANIADVFAESLRTRLNEDDVFIFYFAGHSESLPTASGQKAGYLCPVEANRQKAVSTCISMREIGEWLSLLKSRTVVLILDTCVSGLIAEKLADPAPTARGLSLKKSAPPPSTFPALYGKTVVVLTAGESDQLSTENPTLQHGIFTYYLLQGMQGGADMNADGRISLKDLYEYAWSKVESETSGNQTPTLNIWGEKDVYLIGQRIEADLQLPPR